MILNLTTFDKNGNRAACVSTSLWSFTFSAGAGTIYATASYCFSGSYSGSFTPQIAGTFDVSIALNDTYVGHGPIEFSVSAGTPAVCQGYLYGLTAGVQRQVGVTCRDRSNNPITTCYPSTGWRASLSSSNYPYNSVNAPYVGCTNYSTATFSFLLGANTTGNYTFTIYYASYTQVLRSSVVVSAGPFNVQKSIFSSNSVPSGSGVFNVQISDSYGNPTTIPSYQQYLFKLNTCPRNNIENSYLRFSTGQVQAFYWVADPLQAACVYLSYSGDYNSPYFVIGGAFTHLQNGSLSACQCSYSSDGDSDDIVSMLVDSIPSQFGAENGEMIFGLLLLGMVSIGYLFGVFSGVIIQAFKKRTHPTSSFSKPKPLSSL